MLKSIQLKKLKELVKNTRNCKMVDLFEIKDIDGKVGLWKLENGTGAAKIANNFDTIKLIDKEKQLYLVSVNQKFGVVNGEGNVVIEIAYDEIGINQELYNVKNKYILYDTV